MKTLKRIIGGLGLLTTLPLGADEVEYGEIGDATVPPPAKADVLLSGSSLSDGYFSWKEDFSKRTGLNYLIEYAALSQVGGSGGHNFHADHELNLIGMWDLTDSTRWGKGKMIGWFQNSVTLGGVTTTDFMDSLGVLSPVNGGDTHPDGSANRLQHFAWEQRFPDEQSRVMVGKLTTRVIMNLNRYAVSDREDFFSPMLVNNPVVPFTARLGLGFFGEHRRDDWYVSALIRDADATSDFIDFESVGNGNWEYAAEFGYTPEIAGLGEGNYRVMFHYTDAVGSGPTQQSQGWSVAASFDQDFGESIGGFFRYAYADNPLRTFRQRISLGLQVKAPCRHEEDRLGFAAWWGEPVSDLGDEFGLEAFWRIQATRYLQISPDFQMIFNPALDPGTSVAYTGGLRARFEF